MSAAQVSYKVQFTSGHVIIGACERFSLCPIELCKLVTDDMTTQYFTMSNVAYITIVDRGVE